MSRQNEWFVPAFGISRTVITADIQRYLGPEASVRPGTGEGAGYGEFNGVPGYWITAYRSLTSAMIDDLKADSAQWESAKTERRKNMILSQSNPSLSTDEQPSIPQRSGSFEIISDRHVYSAPPRLSPFPGPLRSYSRGHNRQALEVNSETLPAEVANLHQDETSAFGSIQAPINWSTRTGPLTGITFTTPSSPFLTSRKSIHHQRTQPEFAVTQGDGITSELHQPYTSLADRCGWQVGAEKFLWDKEAVTRLVVTDRGWLGRGSIGEVEEVRALSYGTTMARKRIWIGRTKEQADKDRRRILSEIENLKSLDHEHIVKVLGCYRESKGRSSSTICALMFPSGDNDLGVFLQDIYWSGSAKDHEMYFGWVMKWFKCLASALAYMHSQHILHEDIKPSNIIHCSGSVYFTDFSSSRRFETGTETSTASPALASRMFAAPEALNINQRHGSKSDVFSLGLVFIEMMTVIAGKSIGQLRNFVFGNHSEFRYYHRVTKQFASFFQVQAKYDFDVSGPFAPIPVSEMYDNCIKFMLAEERAERVSAKEVLERFHNHNVFGTLYPCGYDPIIRSIGEEMDWE